MNKFLVLVISTFFFNVSTAQTKAIKITNIKTNKVKIIKENKRIDLKTADGLRIKGKFKIENDNTISIHNNQINLKDITTLKRNSLLSSMVTSGLFIYGGGLVAGLGVIIGVFVDSTAYLLAIPAAGMIYIGIKSPNFSKNYKTDKGWTYEIITISD